LAYGLSFFKDIPSPVVQYLKRVQRSTIKRKNVKFNQLTIIRISLITEKQSVIYFQDVVSLSQKESHNSIVHVY
jgi:hypothetical protein